MDATPHLLAEHVRAKRNAIDNDLELIRVRLYRLDPRRGAAWHRLATALPIIAAMGTVALWMWMRRRRAARVHILRRAS